MRLRDEIVPARDPSAPFRWSVVAVVALGVLARALSAGEGLPYIHWWDEPQIGATALQMMKTGDLNPHFFNYGSLTIYLVLVVDVAHYFFLMGRPATSPPYLNSLGDIRTHFDADWHWTISHPSFWLWDRWLIAAIGAATVVLTYLLARRLAGRWAGLLAAALLAGSSFHVEQSSTLAPNAPATLFAVGAVYLAVLFLERSRPGLLVGALAAAGLAASCKYNAALAVLAPITALVIAALRRPHACRRWLWAAVPAVPLAAFLAGTPMALFDLAAFLRDAGGELRHYAVLGGGGSAVEPGWPHLLREGPRFLANLGPIAAALALLGLPVLLAKRTGWVTLVVPAIYGAAMMRMTVAQHRNLTLLYPFAAAAAGAGAVLAIRALRAVLRDRPAAARAVSGVVALAAALSASYALGGAVVEGGRAWASRETRSRAIDLVEEAAAASGAARVGIAEELRIHGDDLRRLGTRAEIRPYLDLLCDPNAPDLLVAPERWAGYAAGPAEVAKALGGTAPAEEAIVARAGSGRPLHLDILSNNPSILVVRSGGSGGDVRACRELFGPADLDGGGRFEIDAAGFLQMLGPGAASTPWVFAGGPRYAFIVTARGTRARGEYAKLRATVVARIGEEEDAVLAERTLETSAAAGLFVVPFDAGEEAVVSLRLELVNDFWSPSTREDRNAYVGPITLLKMSEPAGGG